MDSTRKLLVFKLTKRFPNKTWLTDISILAKLSALSKMPNAKLVYFITLQRVLVVPSINKKLYMCIKLKPEDTFKANC